MKTIIIIVSLTLIAAAGNAQGIIQLNAANVNVKPGTYEFIENNNSFSILLKENVQGEFEKNPIAFMESNFNIHHLIDEISDRGYSSYNVIFKSRKGELNAQFDRSGTLLTTFLKFHNIAIPKELQHKLYNDHKGWAMVKNTHIAKAKKGEVLSDYYRVKMKKGNQTMNLKINAADLNRRDIAFN